MNTRFIWIPLLIGYLLLAFITSCATAAQETPTLEPTATSVPPPPFEITFEVTFDGNECTVSGPVEVPKGYIYIAIDNKSEQYAYQWVTYFLDGKTYQDFLDEIHIAPDVSHRKPDWVEYPSSISKGDGVYEFNLDETGEYAIFVGDYKPWREYPCGPFQVIEAPSE